MFLDINGWEAVIILVVAMIVIGPERLPEYVAKLRGWIRQLRDLAEGARTQLREEMGPEFDEVDWKAFDPRQYDPRRIVREALLDPPEDGRSGERPDETPAASVASPVSAVYDPDKPTPYDPDAT